MKVNISKPGLGVVLGFLLASGVALADTVTTGSFSESGSIYVSATALDFGLMTLPPPGDQKADINIPTSGPFSSLTSTDQLEIGNLNLSSATVTSSDINFGGSEPDWITLPNGIDLSLNNIPINTAVPVCRGTAAEDVPGTLCRAYASSPIVLEQGVTGVTAILGVSGDAYYTSSPFVLTAYDGKMSADFTGPDGTISGLLGSFALAGSVNTGYSGTFSTTATPEPGTFPALAVGLLAIGIFVRKKMRVCKAD